MSGISITVTLVNLVPEDKPLHEFPQPGIKIAMSLSFRVSI
jgi:hypothetical protein